MIRKPHKDAIRALSGGQQEQIEFVLMYNPMALLDAIHYGTQNVYIRKRELRAAVNETFALLQREKQDKERRNAKQ